MQDKPKEKGIGQIVKYLTTTFKNVTADMDNPVRTPAGVKNETYKLQSEFAWIINEIQQGPSCMVQKYITDCNEFLDKIIKSKKA